MSRGTFRHPIHMKLSQLAVPYRETSFTAKVPVHDRFGYVGDIPIEYYGYIKDGIFYVNSYSFSMDGFRQDVREAYNANPAHTAMMGLEIAGQPILGRRWHEDEIRAPTDIKGLPLRGE